MRTKTDNLPVIAFGEASAVRHSDTKSLGDVVNQVFPGLNAYDPLSESQSFFARSCTLNFPHLQVVASAISPSYVDRDGYQEMTLMFPLAGQCKVTLDGKTLHWGVGLGGVFMPELQGRVIGQGNERSLLLFRLQQTAIERTAAAMFGLAPDESISLNLDIPRLTPLNLAGAPLGQAFSKLGNLIDFYRCQSDVIAQWGLEDTFYRYLVGMLCPEKILGLAESDSLEKVSRQAALDKLCDELLQNLGRRWTLTEMETLCALSARTLQYAFQSRFGCTPMDWLREQRLQQAHRRLLNRDYQSITQLAYQMGFSSPSHFSGYYKLRFGKLPSKT